MTVSGELGLPVTCLLQQLNFQCVLFCLSFDALAEAKALLPLPSHPFAPPPFPSSFPSSFPLPLPLLLPLLLSPPSSLPHLGHLSHPDAPSQGCGGLPLLLQLGSCCSTRRVHRYLYVQWMYMNVRTTTGHPLWWAGRGGQGVQSAVAVGGSSRQRVDHGMMILSNVGPPRGSWLTDTRIVRHCRRNNSSATLWHTSSTTTSRSIISVYDG